MVEFKRDRWLVRGLPRKDEEPQTQDDGNQRRSRRAGRAPPPPWQCPPLDGALNGRRQITSLAWKEAAWEGGVGLANWVISCTTSLEKSFPELKRTWRPSGSSPLSGARTRPSSWPTPTESTHGACFLTELVPGRGRAAAQPLFDAYYTPGTVLAAFLFALPDPKLTGSLPGECV